MKHRTFALLLTLALTLSACTPRGEEAPDTTSPDGTPSESVVPSDTDAPVTSSETSELPSKPYEFLLPRSQNQIGPAFNAETDYNTTLSSLEGFSDSGEGYYFTMHVGLGDYLFYMPKDTLEAVAVCNKPNCLHHKRPNQDSFAEEEEAIFYNYLTECGAYLHKLTDVYYYKGNLYGIGNLNPFEMDTGFYKISLDGTKRDLLQSFRFEENYDEDGNYIKNTANSIAVSGYRMPLHRGKLYYYLTNYIKGTQSLLC